MLFTVKALLVENVLPKQYGCINGLNNVLDLGVAPFKVTEHNVSVLLEDHIGMVFLFEARKRKSRSPDIFRWCMNTILMAILCYFHSRIDNILHNLMGLSGAFCLIRCAFSYRFYQYTTIFRDIIKSEFRSKRIG